MLYQDDDLAILTKPAGLALKDVPDKTLELLLPSILTSTPYMDDSLTRPVIISNGLGRSSSGLVLAVKTRSAKLTLQEAWNQNRISTVYHGLVTGRMMHPDTRTPINVGGSFTSTVVMNDVELTTTFTLLLITRCSKIDYLSTILIQPHLPLYHIKPNYHIRSHLDALGSRLIGNAKLTAPLVTASTKRTMIMLTRLELYHPRTSVKVVIDVGEPERFQKVRQRQEMFWTRQQSMDKGLGPADNGLEHQDDDAESFDMVKHAYSRGSQVFSMFRRHSLFQFRIFVFTTTRSFAAYRLPSTIPL